SSKFRRDDVHKPVILNQNYGLGMTYYDVASNLSYPSLSSVTYKAIAEKEMVSEEMRLIYVALTRAKEQLFLIGRVKDEKELTQFEQVTVSDTHLPVSYRLTAQKRIDMICPILSKYQASSLPSELRFEQSSDEINEMMRPYVHLNTDFYEDVASEVVSEESEQRTVSDIEIMYTNNHELKSHNHQQHSFTYSYTYT